LPCNPRSIALYSSRLYHWLFIEISRLEKEL
jgi:hypothetical protein